ncbi:MAG: fimbrillin family protein [Candidatus Cryptobacteroides sp.]
MRRQSIISIIVAISTVVSCQKNDMAQQGHIPLSFSTVQTKSGLSTIFENFEVWASCISGSSSDLMEGYRVNYDTATGWTYTEGEGTEDQELKFWDAASSSFRFHAGAPVGRVADITNSSLTMDITATTSLSETSLFSSPYIVGRNDPSYGQTVNLKFNYANARVNIAFKYASTLRVEITDIQLTPPAAYPTKGKISLKYDWTKGTVKATALDETTQSTDLLAFPSVSIPAGSTTAIETASPKYMIPDASVKGKWSISMKIDGAVRQTDFTISKAWEPGKSYLYIFEYTDQANLVFIGTDEVLFEGTDLENGTEHNFS